MACGRARGERGGAAVLAWRLRLVRRRLFLSSSSSVPFVFSASLSKTLSTTQLYSPRHLSYSWIPRPCSLVQGLAFLLGI